MSLYFVSIGMWLASMTISPGNFDRATKPAIIDYQHYIDANSILMIVSNVGLGANDYAGLFGHGYGMYYPFVDVQNIQNGTEIKSPLYSFSLWIGGEVGGVPHVAIADFASEYWPGPIRAGSYNPEADTMSAYRVYRLYADSLASNPNRDYLEWPDSLGAPVTSSGKPRLTGSQTLWSVYNDANPARHTLIAGSSAPLGVEVRQTTWATNAVGQERLIYIEYDLFNRSSLTISNFYIGAYYDPDIGGAEDDLTGCDSTTGIFYAYNATNSDIVYGSTPPALGVKLLFGPVVSSPGDSAWYFGRRVAGYRNLKLHSYIGYLNGDDPQSALESYRLLQGLKRDGDSLPNGSKFSFPGDPVSAVGDLDTIPSNLHGLGSVGPIDLLPGDSQSVLVKIGVGQGADRLSSISDLRDILNSPDSLPTDSPIDSLILLPSSFMLEQNYPNPFNPQTTIQYTVRSRIGVSIDIYDMLGRHVRKLVDAVKGSGTYRANWNGCDDTGRPVPTGVYVYRLRAGEAEQSKKMLLLK
ncbi:MAG TPA: T9SS type A sorting domain-containing protein [Candidatus Acidoferrum sp.]|nr:T9SS type A sorting domain-containing protein [Candidatus Acidoferrum sp.]